MKSPLLILLFSLLLLGCHGDPLDVEGYREPVEVGGIIQSDTTWLAADGPYRATENIVIPQGVHWIVEAGTEIIVDWNKAIDIQGTTRFNGSGEERIVVRSEQGIWRGFRFTGYVHSPGGGSDRSGLVYVDIHDAITAVACVDSGRVMVHDCRFFNCDSMGVSLDSGCYASVWYCEFTNDWTYNQLRPTAVFYKFGSHGWVRNTEITGFQHGIRLHGCGCPIIIEENTIVGCEIGVICDTQDSVAILDNEFRGNEIGVLVIQGEPAVLNNTFEKHYEAIRVEGVATPTAHFNNFITNDKGAWTQLSPNDVDASQNWWGTTDEDSVANLIFDQLDDSTLGLVQFDPILTSPSP
ncbi:hypothetical protein AMJ86_06285 [bacterium SM23_57]|nr:MAG: hypothetical protein AMJ86_06285 [bacterium SM23_57]